MTPDELANTLGLNDSNIELLGWNTAEEFARYYKEALEEYDINEYIATVAQGLNNADTGIKNLISGKEIENVQELEDSLKGLTSQYAELIAIRDKSSETYLNKLISIREELDAEAISLNKPGSSQSGGY